MQQVIMSDIYRYFSTFVMITSLLQYRLLWYRCCQHINRILPTHCLLCQQKLSYQETICGTCSSYFSLPESVCEQCATPLTSSESIICQRCHITLPAYDRTIAVTSYKPPADNMVIKLKYHGKLPIAPTITDLLQQRLLKAQNTFTLPDLLCPVPVSRQRLADRGYNQALEIAKPLAKQLGIPLYARLCQRHRHTQSQVLLSSQQRQTNLHHAFRISRRYQSALHNKHVGVIDDVMTTGETLHEIAMTLKAFGAAQVSNFVFARTVNVSIHHCSGLNNVNTLLPTD